MNMKTIIKKAEQTARRFKLAPTKAPTAPTMRNRVAYAAAMEVLG